MWGERWRGKKRKGRDWGGREIYIVEEERDLSFPQACPRPCKKEKEKESKRPGKL
jgi:hypothetical protein